MVHSTNGSKPDVLCLSHLLQNQVFYDFTLLCFAGLKTFSDWPTYPQLYVNGELLGGLDIVKELIESGEFASMVPKKQNLDDRSVTEVFFQITCLQNFK